MSLVLVAQLGPGASLLDIAWRVLVMGAGFAFSMPSLTAAGMGSLPDRSRGVGSGVINTSRQFGFVMGVAILVAIFGYTIAGSMAGAVVEAKIYVNSQSQIPAVAKQQIIVAIEKTAAQNRSQGPGGGGAVDPLAGAPKAAPGSPQAEQQKQLGEKLGSIFKTKIAEAFHWPYYGAALAALLSMPFSLMTGRRLGQDRGKEAEGSQSATLDPSGSPLA